MYLRFLLITAKRCDRNMLYDSKSMKSRCSNIVFVWTQQILSSYIVTWASLAPSQNCKSGEQLRHVCSSVRLSVHMEQLGSHWKNFHEISYLTIFRKSVQKVQISLKSYNNNGYFTWRPMYFTWRPIYFTCRPIYFTWRPIYFTCRPIYFTWRPIYFT